ncbi:hypothetical protein BZG35_16220 [Brevundimonas sp. LM2]|uniref:alpha/beta fold hydrolase n=1 Tax=Brevundimonas sp. LM2 TaxID=1938605 RepID=UPI000983AF0B|nr:alpha/beta hydrolase [Brevundimonas sp. LM2]AQR63030.1 hypothetical protein BZG35_16220 [Brevundimonas sp. LM2]
MPPIILLVYLFNLVSLAVLAAAGWFGWSWYQGQIVADLEGTLSLVRQDWQLWTALALLGWSFLGRFVVLRLLARGDTVATRPVRADGRTVDGVDGASLYVESVGVPGAPTLILTHGWGMDSTIWNYAKAALGRRYPVMAWDLPGVGRSKAGAPNGVSLSAFAANLRTLILSVDGPVVLVGHSIGGMTIQTVARDYPELLGGKVIGAVLVNTTHINPLRTIVFSPLAQALRIPLLIPLFRLTMLLQPLAWLMGWQSYLSGMAHVANRIGFGRFVTRSQLDHTTLLAIRNPPGVLARGNLAMFEWDATAALPTIPIPVLVLGGTVDIVTKLEASQTIARLIPHARLEVVEGVNHMGFLERADLYNAAIAEFADDLAKPDAYPAQTAAASVH